MFKTGFEKISAEAPKKPFIENAMDKSKRFISRQVDARPKLKEPIKAVKKIINPLAQKATPIADSIGRTLKQLKR